MSTRPTQPLRLIHVGVGGRGRWPLDVMGGDPSRYTSVALVDRNERFLAEAKERLSFPASACFRDLADAAAAVEADAVVICTPTATHAPILRAAFSAGLHALVEKGMTYDWAEANALVREADAAGVKFCVAQNYRYGAPERAVSDLLADASSPHHPGKVEIVDYIHHRYRPEPRTLDYAYAMVWDMACHHVDSLTNWLGPVKSLVAQSSNPSWSAYAHDADIAAILSFEGGAVCHYILTHAATFSDWRITLQGPLGTLQLVNGGSLNFFARPTAQLGGSPPVPVTIPTGVQSEAGVAHAFHRYITEGVEPGISGRRNLETLAICEMLVRSARDGRRVDRAELSESITSTA